MLTFDAKRETERVGRSHDDPLFGAHPGPSKGVDLEAEIGWVARVVTVETVVIPVEARHERDGARDLRVGARLDERPHVSLARALIAQQRFGERTRRQVLRMGMAEVLQREPLPVNTALEGAGHETVHISRVTRDFWRCRSHELRKEKIPSAAPSHAHRRPDAGVLAEASVRPGPRPRDPVECRGNADFSPRGNVFVSCDHVDDATERVGSIEGGARPAHDFDPFDIGQVGPRVETGERRA
jgi:hypothetical protein